MTAHRPGGRTPDIGAPMRRTLAILVVGLAAVTLRADDGPVTIKVKQPGPGETIKETKTETSTQKIAATVMGMDMTKEEQETTKFVYTEEVVTRPAGAKRATKLRRTYETAERTKNGEKEDLALAGKTVVIEKAGDGYTITVDGKEPTGQAADLLKKEFRKEKQVDDEDLLPKQPVKVGGTWKIDLDQLAKDAEGELDIDVAKSTGTGKLVKVYDKGGKKFGVMEVTFDLVVNKAGGGGQEVELKAGSKMKVVAVMDACIDGSSADGTGKITTTGDLTGSVMGIDLKITLNSVKNATSEDVKK
jgi:hypothetical protein